MKKLFLFAGMVLAMSGALRAQDCATGYCPATITVHHVAGLLSPVTVDITYGVDKNTYSGTTACWITRNLGATQQATAYNDATAASAGWYWQFNRKQGYSFTTGSRVPNTTWNANISENSTWTSTTDPCTLMLGSTWRIPTITEYQSLITAVGNVGIASYYNTTLKLHNAGQTDQYGNSTNSVGSICYTWLNAMSSSTLGFILYISSNAASASTDTKSYGHTLRCLRTY